MSVIEKETTQASSVWGLPGWSFVMRLCRWELWKIELAFDENIVDIVIFGNWGTHYVMCLLHGEWHFLGEGGAASLQDSQGEILCQFISLIHNCYAPSDFGLYALHSMLRCSTLFIQVQTCAALDQSRWVHNTLAMWDGPDMLEAETSEQS